MQRKVVPNEILLKEIGELAAEGREVELMTRGCSMLPFIRGDRDSVVLVRPDCVASGDIVLAMVRPDVYVLHRIRSIQGDRVILKGDGNLVGTESCVLADVKAKAVRIVSPGGREYDCSSERSKALACRWNGLPYIIRRVILGLYRRALALSDKNRNRI